MQALNLGMGDGVIYKGCKVTKMTAMISQMGPTKAILQTMTKNVLLNSNYNSIMHL